jgi:uncharacterized ion transporter superfamily protein YfcC
MYLKVFIISKLIYVIVVMICDAMFHLWYVYVYRRKIHLHTSVLCHTHKSSQGNFVFVSVFSVLKDD